MQENLKELLKRLLQSRLDFVLVGGMASVVHGSPCHRMNPNFKPSFLDYPPTLEGFKNIYLETDLGVLDAMSELQPIGDFERVKKQSVEIKLFGLPCRLISLEDLLEIKKTMLRPKDKETVLILSEIQKQKK